MVSVAVFSERENALFSKKFFWQKKSFCCKDSARM